jgi:hypothetical protein
MAVLNELLNVSRTRYVSPVAIYDVYCSLGDLDNGFAWLDKAVQERSNGVAYMAITRTFDGVRDDPRYRRVIDQIGLTDVR